MLKQVRLGVKIGASSGADANQYEVTWNHVSISRQVLIGIALVALYRLGLVGCIGDRTTSLTGFL